MNINKKIKIIGCLSLFLFLFCSTSYKAKRNLRVEDQEIRNKIKSVLVIPLYIGNTFLENADEFNGNSKKIVIDFAVQSANDIDKAARIVFENGKFKLTSSTADIKAEELNKYLIKSELSLYYIPNSGEIKEIWNKNYNFDLKKEYIKEIAEKNNVDSVYFHYLQGNRYWRQDRYSNTQYGYKMRTITTYSFTLPLYSVLYYGKMYDKDGNILFSSQDIKYPILDVGRNPGKYEGNDEFHVFISMQYIDIDKKNNRSRILKYTDDEIKSNYDKYYIKEKNFLKYLIKNEYSLLRNFF